MTYRRTNFGTAENEQLIQSVSAQLYAIQAGFVKTKGLLDAGHLEAAHREAQQTQDRIDVAERLILSSRELAQFNPALNVAKSNMTRTWSRFQASAEGRANFGNAIDDVAAKAKSAAAAVKEYAGDAAGLKQDAQDLINLGRSLVGGGSSDGGPPYYLPSCLPGGTPPAMLALGMAYGIGMCPAGVSPSPIPFTPGEPPGSVQNKVVAAGGFVVNYSDRVARAVNRPVSDNPPMTPNRSAPEPEASSGLGWGIGLTIAGGLLKLFSSKSKSK